MKKQIVSPFYTIKNKKIKYLDRIEICDLSENKELNNKLLIDKGVLLNRILYKKFKSSVLVLEPHPDDFVLSALGYCLNKYNVEVLSIFSKTTLKYFPWINKIKLNSKQYENLRIKESNLVVKDILNQKLYLMKEKSLRLSKEERSKIKNRIIKNINEILKSNKQIKTILLPMGVGDHPDHVIIFDLIMDNLQKYKNYNIILYPEYPYSRCRNIYEKRYKQLNNKYILKPVLIDVEDNIEQIVNCISAYKSQFDDIDRNQMLAIFREDTWSISQDYKKYNYSLVYFKVGVK